MTTAHFIGQDTSESYPCISCGKSDYAFIRQDKQNPRLKCNSCGFVYNGADSLALEKAGEIPSSSAETLAAAEEPERMIAMPDHPEESSVELVSDYGLAGKADLRSRPAIPRTPKYVFISKTRKHVEYSTEKDVKSVAMRWESNGLNYDVYELAVKKFDIKVEID